ncbi:uncharacterized protein LOC131433724 isoform X2 [Malaya genurostris]|nr:uncharacterized protein LOC131433724 isoform X2 [Malaya genurostris]
MTSCGVTLLLICVSFRCILALPAQMFSPGIPITPTEIQNPGQITGIFANKPDANIVTRFQSEKPASTVQNNLVSPNTVPTYPSTGNTYNFSGTKPVYADSNGPYYAAPQYYGQKPSGYIYPNGMIPHPRPVGPVSQLISNAIGGNTSWNRLGSPQTVGALATLGTLGTIGALGTLGAGAL